MDERIIKESGQESRTLLPTNWITAFQFFDMISDYAPFSPQGA